MSHARFSSTRSMILVGCGNMGFAMLRGWVTAGSVAVETVHVIEPFDPLRQQAATLGVRSHEAPASLPRDLEPDVIIFAFKPQILPQVLPDYRRFADATFVSIAAGISVAQIEAGLGPAAIIRGMPNTPAAIGKGSTVVFRNAAVDEVSMAKVERLLSAGGAVHGVDDETLIDAATAISGSGPAYVFHFIESLAAAGEKLGLPAETALALAKETIFGAGALAMARADAPAELRRQVTSPGGTTEAALSVLMGGNALRDLVEATAQAAYDRAQELEAE